MSAAVEPHSKVMLPVHLFYPGSKEMSTLKDHGQIIFTPSAPSQVVSGEFLFESGTMVANSTQVLQSFGPKYLSFQSFPYFSIVALVLLIVFRNLFYTQFQKFFLSVTNNFEIDFSFQKIGVYPIILASFIIYFTFIDVISIVRPIFQPGTFWVVPSISGALLWMVPLLITIVVFTFLSLSPKLFPLIFSDLKVLFFLSIFLIFFQLIGFGLRLNFQFNLFNSVAFLLSSFFILRSALMWAIFSKAYKFKIPVTLFYICTLNICSFLFLSKGLDASIFNFYE